MSALRRLANRLGRGLAALLTAALILLIGLNLYLGFMRTVLHRPDAGIFGCSYAVVVSGSMEPTIHVQDLVWIQRRPDYQVGDIVSYREQNYLVTHRIVGGSRAGWIMQGDANTAQDAEPVPEDRIVGKVTAVLPGLGRVLLWLHSPQGLILWLIGGALWIEWGLHRKDRRERRTRR